MSIIEENIIKDSLALSPQMRYLIAEQLLESLTLPNEEIDNLWLAESIKRLNSYKNNTLDTVHYDEVFK